MTIKAELEPNELSDDIEVFSPGQMLQEARVAAKLSQQQVAERLKLRLQVVVDIEADSFDKGLSTTFIKGYLRGYARLVNLSEDLVLSSFAHLNAAEEQRTEMQSFSGRIQQETHDSRLMKFTYLVALGIVALLVVWWLQEKQLEPVLSSLSSESASVLESSDSIDPVAEPEFEAPIEPQSAAPIEPQSELELTETSDQAVAVVSPLVAESEADLPASTTEQNRAEPVESLAAETTHPVTAAEAASSELEQQSNSLQMTFENECWVEVRDANGKRLVAAIKKPGERLSLNALAPYSIVLGTAAGVSIHYGQDKIDLSSFKRGKVVRMKIPQ